MTGRNRLATISLALATGLGLAGCAGVGGDRPESLGQTSPREPAATVDDFTVSVGDVQSATKASNEFIAKQGGQSTLTTSDVLGTLMFAPQILETAQDAGLSVPSAKTVQQALGQLEIDSSVGAVEFIRAQSVREQMSPEQLASVSEELDDADISVNPRYGSFDPAKGLQDSQPDWLAPVEQDDAPGS